MNSKQKEGRRMLRDAGRAYHALVVVVPAIHGIIIW